MAIKTVLFDFDGTVFDTVEGISKSVQYALDKRNIHEELDKLRIFAGPPLVDKFTEVYGFSKEEAEGVVDDFRERYIPTGVYESSPFKGIESLIISLRDAGYKVGIATSKPQIMAELLLKRSDMTELFDVIVGSGMNKNNDAKWMIVNEAMRRLESTSDETVLVGDTMYDVYGAKKCGIKCIGVRWGYAAKGELEDAGADFIAENYENLISIIKSV